jgi:succinate dehydrogenase / fumarate reductase, cytochrome b subunit
LFDKDGRTLATTIQPLDSTGKYHFLLRKLHSLSGIVPIGCFLIEHMLTNSRAFTWFGWFQSGPTQFNKAVHFLHELPFLPFLEIFGIFLPIAFHAIYGLVIAWQGQGNTTQYPHMDNARYRLQRITGYITVVFIIVHLLKFRFAHWLGGPEFIGSEDPFEITRHGLTAWNPWGTFIVPAWFTFLFYWIGLAAACFHFGNGIWGFCISWGLTISPRGQRGVLVLSMLVSIALFIGGGASLITFATASNPGADSGRPLVVEKANTNVVSPGVGPGATEPMAARSQPRAAVLHD